MSRDLPATTFLLLAALAALPGCAAQLATASSGEIGCPRDEIAIRDQSTGWSTSSWTAECRGKSYYCSGVAGSVSCHEQLATSGPATSGEELANTSVAASATKESCGASCEEGVLCVTGCPATKPTASHPHASKSPVQRAAVARSGRARN